MGCWDEGRAEGIPPGDGGQPLRVGTQRLRDHRHFLLAQLRELRRHVGYRAMVLAQLFTDAHLLDRGAETRTGEGSRQDLALGMEIGGGSEFVADSVEQTFGASPGERGDRIGTGRLQQEVESVDGHRVVGVRQAGAPDVGQQVGAGGPAASTRTDECWPHG